MGNQGSIVPSRAALARPLAMATRVLVRFPAAAISLGVALAIVALYLTATRLGFRTSRLDLLNPESGYNQRWIEYIDEFGEEDDAVVVVEGPGREQVTEVLEEISHALSRHDRFFHAILHEVDLSKIRAKGLHYLPEHELQGVGAFLDKVDPILQGDWSPLNVRQMLGGLAARAVDQQPDVASAGDLELERFARSLLTALDGDSAYRSPWPEMPQSVATLSELGSEYLLTNEGRLGFVLLRLAHTDHRFDRASDAIHALRSLLAETAARHPETDVGLTGLPVMENDEMRASRSSMLRASLWSLLGVTCLFVAVFGGVRHPMLCVAALLIGMSWSFGYVTLAVGHLNILSVAFGVILIGLGIDFGVHYAARYLQLRRDHISTEAALVETAIGVGPGIVTGAVTTAIAFFAAALTEFTGVAELGWIAGGGILLCGVAALVLLPAMIAVSDRNHLGGTLPRPLEVHRCTAPVVHFPRLVLVAALILTVAAGLGTRRLTYDHNLLNLQPVELESVDLEQRLLADSGQSTWFALTIADSREELLALKRRYLTLPSVERTEEIASLLPTDREQKSPMIAHIRERLANLSERPALIPVDPPDELGRVLAGVQSAVGTRRGGRSERLLGQVRVALRRLPESECYRRLTHYQQQMAGDLLSRLHRLRSIADPVPPQLSDLPDSLVTRFVGQQGRHLLKIYAHGSIWDMDALAHFVADVRSVDPQATGNPLQAYEASLQMKRSYQQAALYALGAICVVLLIDFRSLREATLALTPLGLGMLQMFGLLGWLGIPLNPANMVVLPLIVGIGIDDGVHVVHDFRSQRGRYRMSASTATSVLLTSLTSMIGFGSLMLASHRGLQSLGRVLVIGVSCCLFTSLVILPALLVWFRGRREEHDHAEEPGKELIRSVAGVTHWHTHADRQRDGEKHRRQRTSSPHPAADDRSA